MRPAAEAKRLPDRDQPTVSREFLDRIQQYYAALDSVRRGVCLLNAGQFAEAAQAFHRAQQLRSPEPSLPALLASALLPFDGAAAADALASRMEDDPQDSVSRIRLALAKWSADQTEEAVSILREGLRQNPECPELHFQLGTLLAALADDEEAELRFSQTLNINREHTDAMIGLALCYGVRGDPRQAVNHLLRAQQNRPHDARIGLLLAQAVSAAAQAGHTVHPRAEIPTDNQVRDTKGIEELARVIETEPDFVDAFLAIPTDAVDERVFLMLLETLHVVLARQPEQAEFHVHCGRVLARLGQSEEAIAENERAVAIDPNCARALIELGKLYHKTNRMWDATSRLEQAVRAGAEYADVYYLLGNLYRDQGQVHKARSAYKRALVLNERYEAASRALHTLSVI